MNFYYGDILSGKIVDSQVILVDELIEQYFITDNEISELKKLKWSDKSINEQQIMIMHHGGGYYVTSINRMNKFIINNRLIRMSENLVDIRKMLITYRCSNFNINPKEQIEKKLNLLKINNRIKNFKYIGIEDNDYYKNIKQSCFIYQIESDLSDRFLKVNLETHIPSGFDIFASDIKWQIWHLNSHLKIN